MHYTHAYFVKLQLESNEILDISFVCLYLFDSCPKKMLLESLNIPLSSTKLLLEWIYQFTCFPFIMLNDNYFC